MDAKIQIKEEVLFSEVNLQTERESFSQNVTMKLNGDADVCNEVCKMEIKTEIKEEALDLDIRPQNDWGFLSENIVMKVNECSKHCEMDTKIEIKEERWWLEGTSTEAPGVDDATKDLVDESFPSTESIRLHGEVSRDKSLLLSDEDLGKHSHECETARKYKSKQIDVPEISSVEKTVYSEQHDDEMDSTSSCLKQSNFIQQNSSQEHDNYKNYCFKSVLARDTRSCEYKCNICEKRFLSPSGLRRHKFHHEGRKPHKCNICEKSFAELSDLKVHKRIHEGQKPHKCDICGNSFTQLSNLRTHKLIHEGKRPHKCDTCEKGFTRSTDLRRHKLIHEGIRPYKCDICGKSFTHLSTLKTHKMIHVGKKTLKCDICGNGYTQLPSFLRHKLTHENKKPHK